LEHLSRDEYVARLRTRACECARSLLRGNGAAIATARELTGILHELNDPSLEETHRVFIGVDSETMHLPLGSVRELWAQGALAACDKELAEAESCHAIAIANACRELLDALGAAER